MVAENIAEKSSKSLWWFLVLLGLLSWPIWVISGVLPRAGTGAYDWRWLVAQVGVFGPSLAALIVSSTLHKDRRRSNLRILAVLLLPLALPGALIAAASPSKIAELPFLQSIAALIVVTLVILFFLPLTRRLLSPGTGEAQARPDARSVLLSVALLPALFLLAWLLVHSQGEGLEISALRGGALGSAWMVVVVFSHNLLLGGSLGEEIGWRGFLLPELLNRMSPIAASLALGVVWGLWHLPIDLYAGFGAEGLGAILMRIIYVLPLSVLFTWFYLGSKGSLLIALLLHTSLNVMGDLGLSRFDSSAMVFFVFMAGAAVIVSVASPAFRKRSVEE
jgi:membrane protease YdiL (CAAX protease family)